MKIATVVLGTLLTAAHAYPEQAAPSDCQATVGKFLSSPDEAKRIALERSACSVVIRSSNHNLNRLNRVVEAGNPWAAQYSAEHLKELDGGNLEDALIALGQFSNHNMTSFLLFAKNGILSERELSDALTMLPLSLSDNPDAQLNAMRLRRRQVLGVTRKGLAQQRQQALAAIDAFVLEISSNR